VHHLTIDRFQNKNKRPRCIKDENGPLMSSVIHLFAIIPAGARTNIILYFNNIFIIVGIFNNQVWQPAS